MAIVGVGDVARASVGYDGPQVGKGDTPLNWDWRSRRFIAVDFPSLSPVEPYWQNIDRAPLPNWIIRFARAPHVPLVPHPAARNGHLRSLPVKLGLPKCDA